MTPEYKQKNDRSSYFFGTLILPSGISVPGATVDVITPGPGHYFHGNNGLVGRPASAPRIRGSSSANKIMGTAKRDLSLKGNMKGDVVFLGKGTVIDVGPGHYSIPNTIGKKSFNVRSNDGNRRPGQGISGAISGGASNKFDNIHTPTRPKSSQLSRSSKRFST